MGWVRRDTQKTKDVIGFIVAAATWAVTIGGLILRNLPK
jgi:hypothetical protein